MPTAIALAGQVISASVHGDLLTQIVQGLTTESPGRADLLFALVFVGCALGAGAWIGWEIARFVARLPASLWRTSRAQRASNARGPRRTQSGQGSVGDPHRPE